MSLATGCQWPGWGTYTDTVRGTGGDPRGIEETVIWALFKEWTFSQVTREPILECRDLGLS